MNLFQRIRKWFIEHDKIRLSVKNWNTLYSDKEKESFLLEFKKNKY